jgi:Asp-tRNA(Asn)/Glu-tRNA(Gln) amidotransferase A subunit family amidase
MRITSRRKRAGAVGIAACALLGGYVATPAASAASRPTNAHEGHSKVKAQDPTTFDISQALAAMKSGKITSVQLSKDFLARINKYEPYYNAFTQFNPNAIKEAMASDRRRAEHKPIRPLDGVPIVIKDILNLTGTATTGAWQVTSPIDGGVALVPKQDAPVVQRLIDAGAVILGKTNLPIEPLAGSGSNANNSAYGPTFSILNRDWAPGGSSTGTGTAVAGDFAVAGIGEETGGSIQNPSSAQSLVGVKPTFGLVPTVGDIPIAGTTRDVLGPIAKNLDDAARILNVIAGYTPEDPQTADAIGKLPPGGYEAALAKDSLKGKRIGLYGPGWRSGPNGVLTPETQTLYNNAVNLLTAAGATVVTDPFAGSGFADVATTTCKSNGREDLTHQYNLFLQGLGSTSPVHSFDQLKAWAAANGFANDPHWAGFTGDPNVEPSEAAFYACRDAYDTIFNSVMQKYHLDGLLFPQETQEIGDIFTGGVSSTTVSEINNAQLPAVVVPDGAYSDGRPFSLEFVGPKFSEPQLLGLADSLTQTPGYKGRIINKNLQTTPPPTPPPPTS